MECWHEMWKAPWVCVNKEKTKFQVSGVGFDVTKKSRKYLCAACRGGVSNNSIKPIQCKLWVHKRCNAITNWLVANPNYICPRSSSNTRLIDCRPVIEMDWSHIFPLIKVIYDKRDISLASVCWNSDWSTLFNIIFEYTICVFNTINLFESYMQHGRISLLS